MSAGPDSLVDREGVFRRLNERESKKNENVAMVPMERYDFTEFLKRFLFAISTNVENITLVLRKFNPLWFDTPTFEHRKIDFEQAVHFGVNFSRPFEELGNDYVFNFFVGVKKFESVFWRLRVKKDDMDETVSRNVTKEFSGHQKDWPGSYFYDARFFLSKSNFLSAIEKFKTFFQVMKDHDPRPQRYSSSYEDARLKIYYVEADETVLPPLIGYTRRDYDEGLKELLRDPIMGQDVDTERATEIVEEFKREKRTRFQDQDIRDAMERAQKRQRTEEEEAALLLLRNGGDMEAAAQMLAKIRFD